MPVLNHHIVAVRDKVVSSRFFTEILGPEDPVKLGEFAVLKVSDDTTLDFVETDADFDRLHYAFLVTEAEFDEIFGRVKERGLKYWATPCMTSRTRSTPGTTAAACISTTRTDTGSRSSHGPRAAAVPRPTDHIRWSRPRSTNRIRRATSIEREEASDESRHEGEPEVARLVEPLFAVPSESVGTGDVAIFDVKDPGR